MKQNGKERPQNNPPPTEYGCNAVKQDPGASHAECWLPSPGNVMGSALEMVKEEAETRL